MANYKQTIMISIHPWWIYKMSIREKTWEIRTRCPKVELPCRVLVYCTKSFGNASYEMIDRMRSSVPNFDEWRGNVVAEFVIDRIEKFKVVCPTGISGRPKIAAKELSIEAGSCVPIDDLYEYVGSTRPGYALHVSEFSMLPDPMPYWKFGVNAAPQYYVQVPA